MKNTRFNKHDIGSQNQPDEKSAQLMVLHSLSEFRDWFLGMNDLKSFDRDGVNHLINEIKPDRYPCIPLSTGHGFDFIFITPEQIKTWSKFLERNNI